MATTVSDRVRAAKGLRGHPQVELASRLGISQQMFSRKLAGRAEFRISELEVLAAALDVPAAWLAFGDPIPDGIPISA
jgi:transcriptional regulator with XRE-family HTH domain